MIYKFIEPLDKKIELYPEQTLWVRCVNQHKTNYKN